MAMWNRINAVLAIALVLGLAPAAVLAQVVLASIKIHHDAEPPYTVIDVGYSVPPSEAMEAAFTPGGMAEIANRVRAYEEQSVQIHIPALLDYGSSGSYSNVRISAGNGGVSLDPNALEQTKKEVWTGNLSITEFTRDVLAGSYSWTLLLVLANAHRLPTLFRVFSQPKPDNPPANYPEEVWPLWFSAHAFRHTRQFTSLFLIAVILDTVIY